MDDNHVTAWMDSYKRSWEKQDADAFVTLFTGDAVYRDTPFDEPFQGPDFHAVWTELATRQSDNRFDFEVMAVSGDMAFVHWWGTTTRVPSGERSKGDGMFVLLSTAEQNGTAVAVQKGTTWRLWACPRSP